MNSVFPQTSRGSFSAVSTPMFASKYSLEGSRRDLHNTLLCTVLESTPLHRSESNLKTMKNASGQRLPGEKQSSALRSHFLFKILLFCLLFSGRVC